jgi:predicted nucleotidyltransferase
MGLRIPNALDGAAANDLPDRLVRVGDGGSKPLKVRSDSDGIVASMSTTTAGSTRTEDPPALAGTKEAAGIFGVRTGNFLRDWAKRPDFPAPIATLAATPVWRREDLERYRDGRSPIPWPPRRRDLRLSLSAARWLPTIKRRLVRGFGPDRIVLFGSQARGQASDDSDLDLLVVVPSVGDRRLAAAAMYAALHGIPIGTDIVVVSVADVERFGDTKGSILEPALREGVSIFARQQTAAA